MRRHIRRLRHNHVLRDALIVCVSFGFIAVGLFLFWAASLDAPDLDSFTERRISQSAKIYDRTGDILLYNFGENTKRTIVSDEEISRNIKNAAVAIEDENFYHHRGIEPLAIIRAILANITSLGFSQGGSTITQQVVKNTLLTSEKKISRKLKEWVLSVKLERSVSKEKILNTYLNESPFGGTLYGVEEASLAYFGKHALDVSLAEAAYLGAIPQAPTYYSPYGNHRDKLDERKNLVLTQMLKNKFITQEDYDAARAETVSFLPQGDSSIKAPHFVFFVRDYLEQKYGRDALMRNGLKVTTTLNFELQAKAEEIVRRYALENVEKFLATNAALVATDPKTGQILTMVGSRDYFDPEIDGNFNVALAFRQPGSAFKPFVYATAFDKGYTPESVLFDLKTQFSTECEPMDFSKEAPCFSPDNYDEKFRGPMSLRDALAQSINVPSVKTLYLAGITDSIRTATEMGITSLEGADRYGLTLVLGGGEVRLLDMVSAYGVFAHDGVRNPYTAILKIEDASGTVLEEFTSRARTVLSASVARTVSDVLSDNAARIPAYGERSPLYFPGHDVAVKTGTTNDSRDAWIVGYTPSISVGAWAGNNDNSPMVKQVAGLIVAPLWHEFVAEALKSLPNESLPQPESVDQTTVKPILRGIWQGGITYTIDKFSGKLATDFTPPEARIEKAVRNIHSILYLINKDDPTGPPPSDPNNDPQFKLWEYPIAQWVQEKNMTPENESVIPTERDTLHTGIGPQLVITGVAQGATYRASTRLVPTVMALGPYPLARVDFYLDGIFLGSVAGAPFSVSFATDSVATNVSTHELKIVGHDSILNKSESVVSFTTE